MPPQMPNPFEKQVSNVKSPESLIDSLPREIREIVSKVIVGPSENHLSVLNNALAQQNIFDLQPLIMQWKADGVIAEKLNTLQSLVENFFSVNEYMVRNKDADAITTFLVEESDK